MPYSNKDSCVSKCSIPTNTKCKSISDLITRGSDFRTKISILPWFHKLKSLKMIIH